MSPKREKNKGDNANMLNNKGYFSFFSLSFFFFLNTKYKQRIHIFKTKFMRRQQSWKSSNQSKARVSFYVDTYRLGYVKMKYHIRPSHNFYQCMLHL